LIFDDDVKDPKPATGNEFITKCNLLLMFNLQYNHPQAHREIFRYTLESKVRDVRELKTLQDWVVDRQLRSVPGVGACYGFRRENENL